MVAPRKAARLHQVFEDFAAAVVGLREYLADGEKEEGYPPGTDPFYDEHVAPLALETLCLWIDRVKGLPTGPCGERLAHTREPNVLDKVGEVAADALNALLLVHPPRCSKLLLTAGAVPAIIHAVDVCPAPATQAAAACALQTLASVNDAIRSDIVLAGAVRPVVKMLRRQSITPVVATAACSVLQNLALLAENEQPIVDGGSIQVLLHHCAKGSGAQFDAADQPVIEAAARALMNLAAGSGETCKAIGDGGGIPVLVGLLKLHKRHNPKTGVLETPTPSLEVIHAAGAALRGIALLPEMQGPLRASGVLHHVGHVLERFLKEQQWIPATLAGVQADALEALFGLMRNMSLKDSGAASRSLALDNHCGTHLGKLMARLIPREPPPHNPPSTRAPDAGALGAQATAKAPRAGEAQSQVTTSAAALILEGLAAARNLSAGLGPMADQIGAAGTVEAVVTLMNNSPVSPWVTTHHCVEALYCLANLTADSEQNRERAVAAACVRQVMTFASNSTSKMVVGGGCMALQSLAQAPEARLKILERDGLKLLYSLLEKALTPPAIAGAAGALVHLGRAAKANLHKFSQLGGGKLLTRVMVDCTSDAALLQMLHLVHIMAVDPELKVKLVEDGVVRQTLALLARKGEVPEALLELSSSVLALVARDKHARSHMLKMGAVPVLEDVNDTYAKHNELIKAETRRAINSLISRD